MPPIQLLQPKRFAPTLHLALLPNPPYPTITMATTAKAGTAKTSANGAAPKGKAAQPTRAEEPNIGLARADMDDTCGLLNELLANYQVLAVKTKNYHWTVVGLQFNDLHKFFEKMYGFLSEEADQVAERVRALGGRPLGSMAAFVERASLKEETREGLRALEMVQTLLVDEEALIRQLRDMIGRIGDELGDDGTADFVTGLMEEREKNAWMLRALAQG